jgi:serine/threonine-protein kinase
VGALAAVVLAWRARASRPPRDSAAETAPDPRRIAVLYFTHAPGDRALAPVADGLTEDLIAALAAVPELVVVSRNGVGEFHTRDLPRDSVARLLRGGTLVLGEVAARGGDSLRVTARLVDGDGTKIRRATFQLPATDPIAARDELTLRVTSFLRERLGDEIRVRAQRVATRSPEAWMLLQSAERARKSAELAVRQGDTVTATARFTDADSTAARAASLDAAWLDPLTLRGNVAYRRSRLAVADPVAADRFIALGLAHADSALARDSLAADALELRGNLRYWRWLLRLEFDAPRANALLADARADLERAVRRAPRQAGAWGTLSHLYYQTIELTDVLLAAQRAYEADAYLENAATIVDRLFGVATTSTSRWPPRAGARRGPVASRAMRGSRYAGCT